MNPIKIIVISLFMLQTIFIEAKMSSVEKVFTYIHNKKQPGVMESISGPGSSLHSTKFIREEIPRIIEELEIVSMLDIPCGDFHWMSRVDLNIPYMGADIVKQLVEENQKKYQKENVQFVHLNLLSDDLPCVDLILCRDCLGHLTIKQIFEALKNIKRSGSKYLLTTGFPKSEKNKDIPTGSWRPINLMAEPFNLKAPILIFNEGCAGNKSLMLWKIEDL